MTDDVRILIAGIDEAGRGPLAGPVSAAAVVLPERFELPGLGDSKKLTEKRRETLEPLIKQQALAWAVAGVSVQEIEALNILKATQLAMRRALKSLGLKVHKALVDGNQDPRLGVPTELIIKGDATEPCISAASILAKTARDRWMRELDSHYQGYGLAGHKGYGAASHQAAIRQLGPSPIHRRLFPRKILGGTG